MSISAIAGIDLEITAMHLNKSKVQGQRPQDLEKAAMSFEAMMMGQMLSHMFSTVPQDGFFSGGPGEKIFRSMLIEEFGAKIAERGELGIADAVRETLAQVQGQQAYSAAAQQQETLSQGAD
ncbi:MAG: rod-binding protein [Pseudomonadota bacterium]